MEGYIYIKADNGKIFINTNDTGNTFFTAYLPIGTDLSQYEQIDYIPDEEETTPISGDTIDTGTTIV